MFFALVSLKLFPKKNFKKLLSTKICHHSSIYWIAGLRPVMSFTPQRPLTSGTINMLIFTDEKAEGHGGEVASRPRASQRQSSILTSLSRTHTLSYSTGTDLKHGTPLPVVVFQRYASGALDNVKSLSDFFKNLISVHFSILLNSEENLKLVLILTE